MEGQISTQLVGAIIMYIIFVIARPWHGNKTRFYWQTFE